MLTFGRKISTFGIWDHRFTLSLLLHESGLSEANTTQLVVDVGNAIRALQGDGKTLLTPTAKQNFVEEWRDILREKYFQTKADSVLSGETEEINHLIEMILNRKLSHMYARIRQAHGVSRPRGSYRKSKPNPRRKLNLAPIIEAGETQAVVERNGTSEKRRSAESSGTNKKAKIKQEFDPVAGTPETTPTLPKAKSTSKSTVAPLQANSASRSEVPSRTFIHPQIASLWLKSTLRCLSPTEVELEKPTVTPPTDESDFSDSSQEEVAPSPSKFIWTLGSLSLPALIKGISRVWNARVKDIKKLEVKVKGKKGFVELDMETFGCSVTLVENLTKRPGGVWEGEVVVTVVGEEYSEMINEFREQKRKEDQERQDSYDFDEEVDA